jgi:hypothetical protein
MLGHTGRLEVDGIAYNYELRKLDDVVKVLITF